MADARRGNAIDAIHCPPRIPRRWHGQERRGVLTSTLDVGGILCQEAPNDGHMAHGVSLTPAADLHQESMAREGETAALGGAHDNHAFYNSTSPLTNDTIASWPQDAIRLAGTHAVGHGVRVHHALARVRDRLGRGRVKWRGACISLPNADGFHGCGVPSDRAAATLLALEDGATVFYADTHTLKALPEDVALPQLRTGVCKVAQRRRLPRASGRRSRACSGRSASALNRSRARPMLDRGLASKDRRRRRARVEWSSGSTAQRLRLHLAG